GCRRPCRRLVQRTSTGSRLARSCSCGGPFGRSSARRGTFGGGCRSCGLLRRRRVLLAGIGARDDLRLGLLTRENRRVDRSGRRGFLNGLRGGSNGLFGGGHGHGEILSLRL